MVAIDVPLGLMNKLRQDRLAEIASELTEMLGRDDFQAENQTEVFRPRVKRLMGDLALLIGVRIGARELASTLCTLSALTCREREVLILTANGKSPKEIAWILNVTAKTSETHRRNLLVKLGCSGVADLTRFAIREGLIEP